MSKKCYRFFGGLLKAQERWLNKMAENGYRLIHAGKLIYEFEKCAPSQVKYSVEFIGQKSKDRAKDYHDFLEGLGYKVFYKNLNLNYSIGKLCWRPWADKGGRFSTNSTTFNRELLIVEKENDGRPFELHTSYADQEAYYRNLRNQYLTLPLGLAVLMIANPSVVLGAIILICLLPVLAYQMNIIRIRNEAKLKE